MNEENRSRPDTLLLKTASFRSSSRSGRRKIKEPHARSSRNGPFGGKAIILHREAHRETGPMPRRYSGHNAPLFWYCTKQLPQTEKKTKHYGE